METIIFVEQNLNVKLPVPISEIMILCLRFHVHVPEYVNSSRLFYPGSDDGRSLSRPMSERDLVNSLTEHAHRIASAVLSQPDTGNNLMQDAQVDILKAYYLSVLFIGMIQCSNILL